MRGMMSYKTMYIIALAAISLIAILGINGNLGNMIGEAWGSSGSFELRSWLRPACDDNRDNDGDGFCDYKGCRIWWGRNKIELEPDPGCTSKGDNDEKDPILCGDDELDGSEQCDDGNLVDGDGCSSTCEHENVLSADQTYTCDLGFLQLDNDHNPEYSDLRVIDVTTGEPTFVQHYFHSLRAALAIDQDGTAYSFIHSGPNSTGNTLVILNPDGTITHIGDTGVTGSIESLAFNHEGRMFGFEIYEDVLYEFDIANGAATPIFDYYHKDLQATGGDLAFYGDEAVYVNYRGDAYRFNFSRPSVVEYLGRLPDGTYTGIAYKDGLYYVSERETESLVGFTPEPFEVVTTVSGGIIGWGDSATCSDNSLCGDGVVDPGEACDDGNSLSGDGCSATCRVETQYLGGMWGPYRSHRFEQVHLSGLWGEGQSIGVYDQPARSTHQELYPRILHTSAGDHHGTATTSLIIAKGVDMDPGGAPLAEAGYGTVSDLSSGTYEVVTSQYGSTWPPWGRCSNKETYFWRQGRTTYNYSTPGSYTSRSRSVDEYILANPLGLYIQATGNMGPLKMPTKEQIEAGIYFSRSCTGENDTTLRYPHRGEHYGALDTYATSKNSVAVGGTIIFGGGYTGPYSVNVSPWTSVGPTQSGAIKPDIIAQSRGYTNKVRNVRGASSGSDESYGSVSGSSAAAPSVGAAALLIKEKAALEGMTLPGSTIKAILLHTASEVAEPGPNYDSGWGLLDAYGAVQFIEQGEILELGVAGTASFEITADDNAKITMVWMDEPGAQLVRDIDMRVSNGQTTYMPWILDPKNPEAPATTGDNAVDTVEQTVIRNGGDYTVTLSEKKYVDGSQRVSIVLSNIVVDQESVSKGTAKRFIFVPELPLIYETTTVQDPEKDYLII